MKRTFIKLMLRKTAKNLGQLLAVGLLVAVGSGFFVTLFTITNRYQHTAQQYFIDNNYASATYYGSFTAVDVADLSASEGIDLAEGRHVQDYRTDDRVVRVVSVTSSINQLHVYSGTMPQVGECAIVKRNADAWGLGMGDSVSVAGKPMRISAIVDSPEFVYLVKNERTPMADARSFGVLFAGEGFFEGDFNEIVVLSSLINKQDYAQLLSSERLVLQQNQINYTTYQEDLKQIETFAYVFPAVFWVLIVAVIYVMLKRTIIRERKQIGIYKAMGVGSWFILALYVGQYGIIVIAESLLGCVGATFVITNIIIGVFGNMFVVPALSSVVYPHIWLIAVVASLVTAVVSVVLSLLGIAGELPAYAMRPLAPRGGKRILLERTKLWGRLSFNSRYALKSSLRNKGRFFASMLGICGACTLLVFSFGFNDSINYTQETFFNDFANYDLIASFSPMPTSVQHPSVAYANVAEKALVSYAEINGREVRVTVVEQGFTMLNLPARQNGVVVPEYYAGLWKVGEGDVLVIDNSQVVVSAVVKQTMGLSLYMDYSYATNVLGVPSVYNTLYMRSTSMAELEVFLDNANIMYATMADDRETFANVFDSMTTLIGFMLICSVVLGFTVLYSVGLINLSARQYEYMFMGVMGYSRGSIMFANIKELILQILLSIPLAGVLGNALIWLIKGEFASDSFVVTPKVYTVSYFIASAIVVAISALMCLVTARQIDRLDIVEGLKVQED